MANKIQIKCGTKALLSILDSAELGYITDNKELFIGNASGGNTRIGVKSLGRPHYNTEIYNMGLLRQ